MLDQNQMNHYITLGENQLKPTKKEEVSRFHICFSVFSGNYFGKIIFEVTKCLFEKKKKNPKPGEFLAFFIEF